MSDLLDLAGAFFGGVTDEEPPRSIENALSLLERMAGAFTRPPDPTRAASGPATHERRDRVEDAVVGVDAAGIVRAWSGGAEALFGGVTAAQTLGQPLAAVLDARGEAPFTIDERGLRLHPQATGRRRDGSSFPLEATIAELRLEGQRAFALVLGDLVARRRAEEEVRRAQTRYRMLVEQIPAVTFMANLGEGENEIYIGPQIEALLGFTQQEWLENPTIWYWQLHPDDRARWVAEFARGCQTGGPFRSECRFIGRDGRIVWIHGEARVIRDDAGRPIFIQGVAFDITEAKNAEEKMREAQEVKAKNERLAAIGQLAGGVAHDLRNPLGAIRNAWYLIGKRLKTTDALQDPKLAQMAGVIDGELGRCGRIIGDLLDFARDRAPYRVASPLDQLVRDAVSVVVKPAPTIQLLEEVPPDLPVPFFDRDQLRQALVNLVQNAAEAVDLDRGVVVTRARAEGDRVIIEVTDNGKGIPPHVKAKLFEPLFTTKTKGTGLGLSIVANIVRRHGGEVTVDTPAGGGTTFRLTLPIGQPSTGPAPMQGGAADLR